MLKIKKCIKGLTFIAKDLKFKTRFHVGKYVSGLFCNRKI